MLAAYGTESMAPSKFPTKNDRNGRPTAPARKRKPPTTRAAQTAERPYRLVDDAHIERVLA